MPHTRLFTMIFAILMISGPLNAAPPISQILSKLDSLRKLGSDITAKVQIVQQNKELGIKQMTAIYFAKDLDDLFLIVMTGPESEKGNGYLKNGDALWMYRRNTRSFQHIQRNENIAGSDANAGDFEAPKYAMHYHGLKDAKGQEIVAETTLSKIPVFQFEIQSDRADVDYPKKILWVRKDTLLPLKEQNFARSGTLIATQYYLKYSEIRGKYIPTKQLVVDEFEKGNRTLWDISDITFRPVSASVFTKSYLENLSK